MAAAEVANVQQQVFDLINTPTRLLLGRPLIGDGRPGAPGMPISAAERRVGEKL
ncbi:hypothetical protein H7J50_01080 [Mycobacterium intermedium]|uniref:hypothetical protein n=1 Tax=Mycobacterium intermedium TaxID=28445 RepID=UPI0012EB0107|nr:hypothetical protein [Mycobacterium intermedium]